MDHKDVMKTKSPNATASNLPHQRTLKSGSTQEEAWREPGVSLEKKIGLSSYYTWLSIFILEILINDNITITFEFESKWGQYTA